MQAQPLIAVQDVQASSRWYQTVLGLKSAHGGSDYEQLTFEGKMVLQLHHWDAHAHSNIGNPRTEPYGNSVFLWFQTNEFDAAIKRVIAFGAQVLEQPKVNSNANHREVWLRDPNGYVVVLAGTYGDLGAMTPNPALNLAPFSRRTLRAKAAHRRLIQTLGSLAKSTL